MIDYEAATFMQSGELLGVVFGVLLNLLLPRVAIIIFLFLLLSYNTRRTLRKAFATRAKETAALLSEARKMTREKVAGLFGGAEIVLYADVLGPLGRRVLGQQRALDDASSLAGTTNSLKPDHPRGLVLNLATRDSQLLFLSSQFGVIDVLPMH